jgi:site-specific recombinase XerD
MVPMGEIANLVDSCVRDESPAGARDAAIIGCLYIGGLRRAEAAKARFADLDRAEHVLRVIGKGNKERKVFLDTGTSAALDDWLTYRGSDNGSLFVRVLKGGRLVHRGLTDQAIYDIVQRRWKQAGIPPVSPHDFRKTFISTLLSKGVDVFTVQRMAGHANPQTTSRYDLRPEEEARAAAELLHLPYRHRTLRKKTE